MANSYVLYPGQTGVTTDYSITFEYLSEDYVKATVDGVDAPFTFLSTYMIRFSTAPVGDLKIYRETSKSPVNVYTNGSILLDDDVNESFTQGLHLSEEASDAAMRNAVDGTWDATNVRIKNVADPVNAQDAVTKAWAETTGNGFVGDAEAAATAAAASASSAATSATSASGSATTATTKASEASTSATSASGSATTATTKATEAAASATSASGSATTATTKASEAAASATAAATSASQAATSATAAQTAETNAETAQAAAEAAQAAAEAAAGGMTPVEDQILAAATDSSPGDTDTWGYVVGTALMKLTWANIKAALKSYFDTLYATVAHGHIISDTTGLQTALDLKAPSASPTFTGTVVLPSGQVLIDPAITGCVKEDVYTITDGAAFEIDPSNGAVQTITLGASRTPAATNFQDGESVALKIADGSSYTITWTTVGVVWKDGTAPTLATSGYTLVVLWKEGGVIRGTHVGDFAS